MFMNPLAALLVVILIAAVLALPFLIMRIASRGGTHLIGAVRIVGALAILAAIGNVIAVVASLSGAVTRVSVPVSPVPIKVPDGVTLEGLVATFTSGGFDRASVVAQGLSLTTKLALGAAPILWAVITIALVSLVFRLVRSLDDGDPFGLSAAALAQTGWIVMVGGTIALWVGNLGDWLTARELFQTWGWSATRDVGDVTDLAELGWPGPDQLRLDLPWVPLVAGLTFAVLAAVFRYGARLRQDAEGLV